MAKRWLSLIFSTSSIPRAHKKTLQEKNRRSSDGTRPKCSIFNSSTYYNAIAIAHHHYNATTITHYDIWKASGTFAMA